MMSTPLTLLAAGSLKSAFLPLVAYFQQQTGLAVDAQFGPAGLLRERIEPGPVRGFCFRQRGAPAGAAPDGSGAGMPGICRQPADADRQAVAGQRWPGLAGAAQHAPPAAATSTPGCDPSGDYTWQLFARIEARYPGLGNAMAGRAQPLVGGRDSLSVPPGEIAGACSFARIWRICLSATRTMPPRWPPATICVP